MDSPSRLHPNKAFPLSSSQTVLSLPVEHEVTASTVLGAPAGFILVDVVTFQKYAKLMQRLSRFKGKDVFNMDSTERNIDDHNLIN